jgi:PadR family transcriptional regulator, regulatory protein PadR
MRPMYGQAIKGHLDLLLLSVVGDDPQHGYAIIESLRERSGGVFDLPEGTIYPALHRLEQAGFLSSRWSDEAARRRRVYRITKSGRRELERGRVDWSTFSQAVQAVIA